MSTGQMHPGMHPIDDDLVRRLVAEQFPQWTDLPVKRWPSGGTVNVMYRLGDNMAVRLPLVEDGARDVSLEQEWLPRLAPLLPTRIPEVLGAGVPTEDYPWRWSVYRWQPGEHPEEGTPEDPVLLAKDLAEFVTAMRNITMPGAPTAHRGGPVTTLDEENRAAIRNLRETPEENVDCDAATAIWEETLRTPAWSERPGGGVLKDAFLSRDVMKAPFNTWPLVDPPVILRVAAAWGAGPHHIPKTIRHYLATVAKTPHPPTRQWSRPTTGSRTKLPQPE